MGVDWTCFEVVEVRKGVFVVFALFVVFCRRLHLNPRTLVWWFPFILLLNCLLWGLRVVRHRLIFKFPAVRSLCLLLLSDETIKIFIQLVWALPPIRVLYRTLVLPHLHQIYALILAVVTDLGTHLHALRVSKRLAWVFTWWLALDSPARCLVWFRLDPLVDHLLSLLDVLYHGVPLRSSALAVGLVFDLICKREIGCHGAWLRREGLDSVVREVFGQESLVGLDI